MSKELENRYEEMASFFNERAEGYENHMKETVNSFDAYYHLVSDPILRTLEPVEILDLGCGTGLEIKGILEKAPNAKITCIDMSEKMLEILLINYQEHSSHIRIIKDSYLTVPYEQGKYDYVISVMTMHHFLQDEKRKLYEKTKKALKDGGKYIEGDYIVSAENEEKWLEEYKKAYAEEGLKEGGLYHIDIPFSMETQQRLLKEAGFNKFQLIFREGEHAIYFVE